MLESVTCLTFDCYGTLIDWELGILTAVEPVLAQTATRPSPEAVLRSFIKNEQQQEAADWKPYRQVLSGVQSAMAEELGFPLLGTDPARLAESLPTWPPFADTVEALQRLSKRFRLAVVSNTDDALFAGTHKQLKVPFETVVTAEQVKSYKPASAHFREVLRRLDVPVSEVLHVAQSLYHDHVPARQLGFRSARIERPSRVSRTGLAPQADVQPDFTFADLSSLASFLNC